MTSDEFLRLLRSDRGVYRTYRVGDIVGMIAVYIYNQVFVIHWEEYREGDHRNRAAYLRDEMHDFMSADEVLAFVEQTGHPVAEFKP